MSIGSLLVFGIDNNSLLRVWVARRRRVLALGVEVRTLLQMRFFDCGGIPSCGQSRSFEP